MSGMEKSDRRLRVGNRPSTVGRLRPGADIRRETHELHRTFAGGGRAPYTASSLPLDRCAPFRTASSTGLRRAGELIILSVDSDAMSHMIPRMTIGPTLDPHNVSDAIDVLSQRNGFHISDIGISEIPYRRIAE